MGIWPFLTNKKVETCKIFEDKIKVFTYR